ncbi:MAG: hypothetical protein GY928_32295 [Colwellia sp.]|nr:hypothetical protein [Colwellia sp.]
MKSHPHKTSALIELLKKLYGLGWYGGTHDVCKITIEGGFEHNLTNRANESWGLVFVVEVPDLFTTDKQQILKADIQKAETLDEAIQLIIANQTKT